MAFLETPHPEEAAERPSRKTHSAHPAHFSPRRVTAEELSDPVDRGLQVLRPLPLAQYFGVGRQLCDLVSDYRRVRWVVAGHDEIAAEPVVAEPGKDALVPYWTAGMTSSARMCICSSARLFGMPGH